MPSRTSTGGITLGTAILGAAVVIALVAIIRTVLDARSQTTSVGGGESVGGGTGGGGGGGGQTAATTTGRTGWDLIGGLFSSEY